MLFRLLKTIDLWDWILFIWKQQVICVTDSKNIQKHLIISNQMMFTWNSSGTIVEDTDWIPNHTLSLWVKELLKNQAVQNQAELSRECHWWLPSFNAARSFCIILSPHSQRITWISLLGCAFMCLSVPAFHHGNNTVLVMTQSWPIYMLTLWKQIWKLDKI